MEKSVKGTRTEQNLLKSFAGESQAFQRYTMFAKQARKDGYEQIAAFFEETASDEKKHAQVFFEFLEGGPLEITATYPAGIVKSTVENLKAAAAGEHEEWELLYSDFAKIAEEEGFKKIAAKYRLIATVEQRHEERYLKLKENLEKEQVFKREEKKRWKCRECGYTLEGNSAPNVCPLCEHPQAFFEILGCNF